MADDLIDIEVQVIKYMYIPTGTKRKLVRFGVDCDHKKA